MNQKYPWFSEEAGFFGPKYLREYGEALTPERTLSEVDFVERILNLEPNNKILDVPCGHGRHSVELAKRGYDVTGVELNKFFLEVAQKAADEAKVSLQFKQEDMRELNFDAEFDVALNLFTAMGYFEDDEDDRKFMTGIYRSLKPGGQFLIDFMNRNWLIRNFKARDWNELPDGTFLLTERKHDDIRGLNSDRRIEIRNGVVSETATSLRVYTTNELVSMAESVGFTLKESFGDFEGTPLGIKSSRTILQFVK